MEKGRSHRSDYKSEFTQSSRKHKRSRSRSTEKNTWSALVTKVYIPLKVGSIDGTDTEPHDNGIVRAMNSEYYPNHKVKGKPKNTLFICKLHCKTTEETIKEKFSRFGRVKRCRLVRDIVTGASKCYAFVEYEEQADADDACYNMHKQHIDGLEIFVDFECERVLSGWRPRRLGGGFGGKKESGQLRFGGKARPFRRPIDVFKSTHDRQRY